MLSRLDGGAAKAWHPAPGFDMQPLRGRRAGLGRFYLICDALPGLPFLTFGVGCLVETHLKSKKTCRRNFFGRNLLVISDSADFQNASDVASGKDPA